MDLNDVLSLIKKGEGEEIEFKRTVSGIGEVVSAFANTKGGTILIGVDDEGSITGVSKNEEERLTGFLNSLRPMPPAETTSIKINGRTIIVINIKHANQLVAFGNIAYIRAGRGNRPLSLDELMMRAVELRSIRFDELPSSSREADLNQSYLDWYFEMRENVRGVKKQGSNKENLRKLRIIVEKDGEPFLSYAGLLFFSDVGLPHTGIRVARLDEKGETLGITEFSGPLWKIVDKAFSHLISVFSYVEMRPDVGRRRILEYPEGALREALVNAVIHRNYAMNTDVRVFITPDKLLIRSPGGFPPSVTPEDPEHVARNEILCGFFYDIGYVEKYGFGITKMKEESEDHPFVNLEILPSPNKVDVLFRKTTAEPFDDIDRKIISMLKISRMSSSEIAERVGMSRMSVVRRLKKLMSLNIIEKHGKGPKTSYEAVL